MAKRRIVIVGATSTIAINCARIWLDKPIDLVLIGRQSSSLEIVCSDFKREYPSSNISSIFFDWQDVYHLESMVSFLFEDPVDLVLIAIGAYPNQGECQKSLSLCASTLFTNGPLPVLLAEAFANQLEKYNNGTLAVIGSVSGDRGRKSNYIYGSSKSLVSTYVEGLQHRFYNSNVNIVLIKPGPTATPMARYNRFRSMLANPKVVASQIVRAIDSGTSTIYTPKVWFLVMFIIRIIPSFIFFRLKI